MTTSKVKRLTVSKLDGSFGPDRNKRVVLTFIPGDGDKVPDVLTLRPLRTRRAETIAVLDVYRYAMRCRVNLAILDKARSTKAAKSLKREARRIKATERRLFSNGSTQ